MVESTIADESATETVKINEIQNLEPEKLFIDNTEGREVGEFEKVVDSTETKDGIVIITRNIVPMSDDEIISFKTKTLKTKVALGTATIDEKSDLSLLIG